MNFLNKVFLHFKVCFFRFFFGLFSVTLIPDLVRTFCYRVMGCSIDPTSRIAPLVFLGGRNLTIGPHVYINIGCFLDGSGPIFIGEWVRFGPYVKILTGTHAYRNNVLRRGPGSGDISKPVSIERGCWIGLGVTVMPGVTIMEGCVIAAGSVVTHSTTPNGLYAGVPARRIKDLPVE